MSLTIESWPFRPDVERLPEETERWWQSCYCPPAVLSSLEDVERSVALFGEIGSGKSVTLAALKRDAAVRLRTLTFEYSPPYWPGGAWAYDVAGNHVAQLTACAAETIKDILVAEPAHLDNLSNFQRGFFRWLMEKRRGRRALLRWAESVGSEAAKALAQTPFKEDLFSDTFHWDVKDQIEELILLVKALGYERIMALIDVPTTLDYKPNSTLDDLLGWLEPLQHPGFELKLALPENVVPRKRVRNRSRGRVTFVTLEWSLEEVRQIANRHLIAATGGAIQSMDQLAEPKLLQRAETEIEKLFGQPSPRGWVGLAHTLLTMYAQAEERCLQSSDYAILIREFYRRWVPLRLDAVRNGVWRGPQFVELDQSPFIFLEALWKARHHLDNEQLRNIIGGSSAYVNTLASRVRKKIEPENANDWVYLHNQRSYGYWLEHIEETEK